ncbi:MAG: transposase [bacterium]|nr:transposase [bacterium]
MPQSLAKIITHIIFSTKNRTPFLSKEIRPQLYSYMAGILMAGILDKCNSKAILIGGVEDHVHILCLLSKNLAPCKIIEEVKKGSSKWIKPHAANLAKFQWQNGYGIFSVRQSNVEVVQKYIAQQEDHHRKISFQDEFRGFLKKYGLEYDERYVWD